MNDIIDLLQIKIERAKENLPEETSNAISAVDWKEAIMRMREKKGYNFEQLGDLELETELLLCGLLSPKDYPKELEKRMGISRASANELVNEMNDLVFKKIREELIKNAERKKIFQKKNEDKEALTAVNVPMQTEVGITTPKTVPEDNFKASKTDSSVLKSSGIEIEPSPAFVRNTEGSSVDVGGEKREDILEKIENPEGTVHPILQQKILSSLQIPVVKTEYSLDNLSSKKTESATPTSNNTLKTDPYRELPE